MIPVILAKRKSKVRSGQTFNKLLVYIQGSTIQDNLFRYFDDQKFEYILNYTTNYTDNQSNQEKCIAIRIHGVTDISTASTEMNAVSARNTRCKDPAFHFVLTWPEHERPHSDLIFDAAEHAIKSLGLADHQYVLAIHVNTDNIHCHAAVNRINPDTFKSRNIEWANKTIHMAARQSEIKHGWEHDNGIYIIKIDGHNQKSIILNPDHDYTTPLPHRINKQKSELPTWHDPDNLDSWLKSIVSKALKHAIPAMSSWYELHVWLANHGITLTDAGGGGMRLHATSEKTGEVIDLPASKGLRGLKRSELEIRWGKFTKEQPIPFIVSDFSHLTRNQTAKTSEGIGVDEANRLVNHVKLKREERRDQRAAARADLRRRFSQYRRFIREDNVDYFNHTNEIRKERSQTLKLINEETKAARLAVRNTRPIDTRVSLLKMAVIDLEGTRRKLEAEAIFQAKIQSLHATRLPPLGWREWLYEQSNLGDQAAISALRGIVYQAQRDAKRGKDNSQDLVSPEADTDEYRKQQFHKLMDRLLAEEKNEVAIRSSRNNEMRPYQVDALLVRHVGMQWYVTGNGNIVYSDQGGDHLFTDRGNRITFDRERVTDEDIRLALTHARQKFGNQISLTGADPVFTTRMARFADDMGIIILNPELQVVIENHRNKRSSQGFDTQDITPAICETTQPKESEIQTNSHTNQAESHQESTHAKNEALPHEIPELQASQERLRSMVLAIDPGAKFVIPDISNSYKIYSGPVAAVDSDHGYAQRLERGAYALHQTKAPEHHNNASIKVQYHNGLAATSIQTATKGKAR